MPDWKELDHRIVVVTGFSQHLAYFGLGMIASVQAHMPLKKIIVYNLGIHPKLVKTVRGGGGAPYFTNYMEIHCTLLKPSNTSSKQYCPKTHTSRITTDVKKKKPVKI